MTEINILERVKSGVKDVALNLKNVSAEPLHQDIVFLHQLEETHESLYPAFRSDLSLDERTENAIHLNSVRRFYGESLRQGQTFESPESVLKAYDRKMNEAIANFENAINSKNS